MNETQEKNLRKFASQMRRWIIEGVYRAQSGHPGGSLSATDIIAYLYQEELSVDPKAPRNPNRDRFVLSKGHCAPALYAALGLRGFFDIQEMKNLRQFGSFLQGHPCMSTVPGVDMSTGSLGQGISAAVGMALAAKLDGKDYRVYCVMGDGELQEGEVWEAFMCAAHYHLDNLCVIIDHNGLQIDGATTDVMNLGSVNDKMTAFGWHSIPTDGHDFASLEKGFAEAKQQKGMPSVLVAKTVKGKGVSFMENQASWHGSAPKEEQYNVAVAELDALISKSEEL